MSGETTGKEMTIGSLELIPIVKCLEVLGHVEHFPIADNVPGKRETRTVPPHGPNPPRLGDIFEKLGVNHSNFVEEVTVEWNRSEKSPRLISLQLAIYKGSVKEVQTAYREEKSLSAMKVGDRAVFSLKKLSKEIAPFLKDENNTLVIWATALKENESAPDVKEIPFKLVREKS
jgi:hypothetical protein